MVDQLNSNYCFIIYFFRLFLRLKNNEGPNILIMRDYDNYIFGVFCSDPLKQDKLFYGSGETFLFTFYDTIEISAFHWTNKFN